MPGMPIAGFQQSDDEGEFYDPVTEKIECVKMLSGDGEVAGQHHQMAGDEIMGILNQLVLCQAVGQGNDRVGADERQNDTAYAFNYRVCTLEQQANLENLMDAMLVSWVS